MNGDVDWAGNFIPAVDRTFVSVSPETRHYWFALNGTMVFLYPNHEIEALRSQGTREAISAAINRERLVDIAMFGYTGQRIAHLTVMAFQRGSPSSIGRPSFIRVIVKRFPIGPTSVGHR